MNAIRNSTLAVAALEAMAITDSAMHNRLASRIAAHEEPAVRREGQSMMGHGGMMGSMGTKAAGPSLCARMTLMSKVDSLF